MAYPGGLLSERPALAISPDSAASRNTESTWERARITVNHPVEHVHVCAFKGLQNIPLYVALEQRLFAANGLDVTVSYTVGSAPQLAGLARGEYDLIQTAPDNVVNFNTAPTAFGIEPQSAPRVVMILGGSNGPLSVYSRPDITTWDALRGGVVGADNPGSGFALVLRDLLARRGLLLERDYTMTVAGSTSRRVDALIGGDIAATILYAPFDRQAEQHGCHRLVSSPEYYPAYASLATAATHDWLAARSEAAVAYLRSMLQSLRWIHDPARAGQVKSIMVNEPALSLAPESVDGAFAAFTDPATGFGETAALDDAALRQVIAIRAALTGLSLAALPVERFRDPRWYDRALRSMPR